MMNASLEELWREFAQKLRDFIRGRVSDTAAAEDILQDIFVKIHGRLDQVRDPLKVQGWLFLIARNAIIDYYRTRKPTTEVSETLAAEEEIPDDEMEGLKESFRRMISSLPDNYREALVLTEFEGLTQQELADRLGISLSGAKSRVQRARAQLKELLHQCCSFEFDRRGKVIDCTPKRKERCRECA